MSLTDHQRQNNQTFIDLTARSHCDQFSLNKAATAAFEPNKKMRRSISDDRVQFSDNCENVAELSCDQRFMANSSVNPSEYDECDQIYRQYRRECEQLMRCSSQMNTEMYVKLLEKLVTDLLDQNQCLVENIVEIKQEAANRVDELQHKLENSAARTEEVMLSLESHELHLKNFVQQHCCCCCGCDLRLMEFRVCHGTQCDEPSSSRRCHSYDHEWNSIINQTSEWFTSKWMPSSCVHNVSSQVRFTHLVDRLDSKVHQLEAENQELRLDNQHIRELNSLLSCRKGTPITIKQRTPSNSTLDLKLLNDSSHSTPCIKEELLSLSPTLNKGSKLAIDDSNELNEDLLTFLNYSDKHDLLATYLTEGLENRDSLDSCDGSRPDSLNGRHDNDSGCSTDMIPSQTDIHSLMLSDCEDDCEDVLKNIIDSIRLEPKDIDGSSAHSVTNEPYDIDNIRSRLRLAERLVPKLYNKLLYYLIQRNMLLRQFQHENRARQKCKQELSSLTDSLVLGLKDIEYNAKAIKKHQLSSIPTLF